MLRHEFERRAGEVDGNFKIRTHFMAIIHDTYSHSKLKENCQMNNLSLYISPHSCDCIHLLISQQVQKTYEMRMKKTREGLDKRRKEEIKAIEERKHVMIDQLMAVRTTYMYII